MYLKTIVFNFYIKTKETVANLLSKTDIGTELGKIARGLLILIESFENYAEIKEPEYLIFPLIKPPEPRPSDELLKNVGNILSKSKQILLMGPPGTGKTHLAMWVAHAFTIEGKDGVWILVQFHQSYRYEDFIERIILKPHDGVKLEIEPQLFVRLCLYAQQNPSKKVVLVIDEINRADVASVFGELIYAIEYRGYPVKLAYSKDDLTIPDNLYIIATANDVERGTFDIGVALRRRFEVIRMDTKEDYLRALLEQNKAPDEVVDLAVEIFRGTNKFFERIIGKKGIGHLFFRDVNDVNSLKGAWYYRIRPLIEAYFYAPGTKEDASKLINNIESRFKQLQGGTIG